MLKQYKENMAVSLEFTCCPPVGGAQVAKVR